MSEPQDDIARGRALWQQWVSESNGSEAASGAGVPVIDALVLAAYADGGLAANEREAIEELLAEHPELAEDVALARAGASQNDATDAELAAVVARASALVPGSGDRVIAFRPARRGAEPRWRDAARWSALAASFALVSYLGFALGSDASMVLAGLNQSVAGQTDELLDPPTGLFSGLAEVSGT
jgi:anti-sigma factor RsiW